MPRGLTRLGVGMLAIPAIVGTASAHGLAGQRFQAPVPLPAILLAAGAIVAGAGVGLRWRGPGAGSPPSAELVALPAWTVRSGRLGLRLLGLLALAAVILRGLDGPQTTANPALALTWTVGLYGVGLLAIVAGDPWRWFSPWRTLYAGLRRLEGTVLAVRPYPRRLGVWPAVAGLLVIVGIVGTLTVVPRSPRLTAVALTLYAAVMLAGAVLFGPEWLDRADALAVLYRFLGRVAPLRVVTDANGGLVVGSAPWRRDPPTPTPGSGAFAVAAIYTLAFDGVVATRAFGDVVAATRSLVGAAGVSVLLLLAGFGLALAVAWGAGRMTGPPGWRSVTPVLVPVVGATVLAHGVPAVATGLWTLPGVGDPAAILSPAWIWAWQVLALVGGHVVAAAVAAGGSHPPTAETATDGHGDGSQQRRGTGHAGDRRAVALIGLLVLSVVASVWAVSAPALA